jgi:hypothetical protein
MKFNDLKFANNGVLPEKFDNPNYFVIPMVIFENTRYSFKTMSTPMAAPFIMFAPICDIIFHLSVKKKFLTWRPIETNCHNPT